MNKSVRELLNGTAVTAMVFPRGVIAHYKPEKGVPLSTQGPPTPPPRAPLPEDADALFRVVREWQGLEAAYLKAVRFVADGQKEHDTLLAALTGAERRLAELTKTVADLRAQYEEHGASFSMARGVVNDPVYKSAGEVLAKIREQLNPAR